jgi:hypothetical protein
MGLQKELIQQTFETEETNEQLSPESNVGRPEDEAVLISRPLHSVIINSRLVM